MTRDFEEELNQAICEINAYADDIVPRLRAAIAQARAEERAQFAQERERLAQMVGATLDEQLIELVQVAKAEERERCAKIAEATADAKFVPTGEVIAEAIRALRKE